MNKAPTTIDIVDNYIAMYLDAQKPLEGHMLLQTLSPGETYQAILREALEGKFHIHFTKDDIAAMRTVDDVRTRVEIKLGEARRGMSLGSSGSAPFSSSRSMLPTGSVFASWAHTQL